MFSSNLFKKSLTLREIENAFTPAKEVIDSARFAGRKKEVENAYYALMSEGVNIAVYGNRGVGKTSLSKQIINIASGDTSLIKKLGFTEEKLDFLCVYLACGGIENHRKLLERLVTSNDCLAEWIYQIPSAKKTVEAWHPSLSAGVASIKADTQTEESTSSVISQHDIEAIFTNALGEVAKAKVTHDGVLIVLDEFDQIKDSSGFASFMKSLATNVPQVRFCITGVAHDIRNLMTEHGSIDRLFSGSLIEMKPMTDDELTEVIELAEKRIESRITFDDTARIRVLDLAQGHPYMVHLIGKFSLRLAFEEEKNLIDNDLVNRALSEIAARAADPILEGRYKKAVGSSSQREIVLKSMAQVQKDGEIHTKDAYPIALEQNVDNSSQYVGQLVLPEYGAEITKVRERYYRFNDSLFHAYVIARPSVFPPVAGFE